MPAEKASLASRLEKELASHGHVRPPWAFLPSVHPFDIAWRMGEGEGHLLLWGRWLAGLSPGDTWAKALAAVKPFTPIPADWAFWTLDALGLSTEEDPYDHSFDDAKKRLADVGLEVTGEPTSESP